MINNELNTEDRNWISEEITPYVIKFLMKTFPESIIVQQFDRIDITVLDENLPVEIQALSAREDLIVSHFEDDIRRQVEQNVEISGRCWIFFDDKLLRYLNNDSKKNVSINLDWLYKLWKLEKVRLFTLMCDGTIKEMIKDDWKFLSKLSQTCVISKEDDYRILQKNRIKIFYSVIKALEFTTEEIECMYNSYLICNNKDQFGCFEKYLKRDGCTKREFLYSDIKYSMSFIEGLNDSLSCGFELERSKGHFVHSGIILGMFEQNDVHSHSKQVVIRFSDKYNIAKYFPGYIRNKELWDYLKTRWLNRNEFYGIMEGTYSYTLIKKQSTMENF